MTGREECQSIHAGLARPHWRIQGQPGEKLNLSQTPPSISFSHPFWLGAGGGVTTEENTGLLLGFHSSSLIVLIARALCVPWKGTSLVTEQISASQVLLADVQKFSG